MNFYIKLQTCNLMLTSDPSGGSSVEAVEVFVQLLHVLALFLLKCCFNMNREQSER